MIIFATTLLLLVGFIICIPVLLLCVQVSAAMPRFKRAIIEGDNRPRSTVLIPAHDEEVGVVATISSILPQLHYNDRLVVIADNCSDATAQVALAAGAEVYSRMDLEERGKGFALAFGVEKLSEDPPEVLIIIDADCIAAQGTISTLAYSAMRSARPVQSLNLMYATEHSPSKTKVAEFAWTVKNFVRPLGFHRLGFPCHLMGTGMAFPWNLIATSAFGNSNLVEDMALGIDLAKAGTPPLFCPEALVTSSFPSTVEGARAQRTRWEHGHLSLLFSAGPKLFSAGLRQRKLSILALALDLCIPPVALLVLLSFALFSVCLIFALFTGAFTALQLSSLILSLLICSVIASWWRYGREKLAVGDLLTVATYIFWKIPIYVGFLYERQVAWVRSRRDTN